MIKSQKLCKGKANMAKEASKTTQRIIWDVFVPQCPPNADHLPCLQTPSLPAALSPWLPAPACRVPALSQPSWSVLPDFYPQFQALMKTWWNQDLLALPQGGKTGQRSQPVRTTDVFSPWALVLERTFSLQSVLPPLSLLRISFFLSFPLLSSKLDNFLFKQIITQLNWKKKQFMSLRVCVSPAPRCCHNSQEVYWHMWQNRKGSNKFSYD